MNTVLCCDGNANGLYYATHRKFEVDDEFAFKGSNYVVIAWPSGELVAVEISNLDMLEEPS